VKGRQCLQIGLTCGCGFCFIAVSFAALSLFTDIGRATWVVLNHVKGALGFSLCALAGFLCTRRGHSFREAGLSGLLAAAMAAVAYPVSIYALAYGGLDSVRQYAFEYHSMLYSGLTDARQFLLSERGRAAAFETTIGLIPIVLVWAGLQGGLLALAGGAVARGWKRGVG
jgi:hypothetical protein